MGKLHRKNKIVVLLKGRHAGKKAIILRAYDKTDERPYPHCLVAGIETYPRKIVRGMSRKAILKNAKVRSFIKHINVDHMVITRYTSNIIFSEVTRMDMNKNEERLKARKIAEELFTSRFLLKPNKEQGSNTGNEFFFEKLVF